MRALILLAVAALAFLVPGAGSAQIIYPNHPPGFRAGVRFATAAAAAATVNYVDGKVFTFSGTTGSTAFPTAANGDLVIVQLYRSNAGATSGAVTSTGGAWTTAKAVAGWTGGNFNNAGYFYRVVNLTDLGGSISFSGVLSGEGAGIYVYHGATACIPVVPAGYASNATLTASGFTPTPGVTQGAVVLHMTRNTAAATPSITGWSADSIDQAFGTLGRMGVFSRLSGYAGGNVVVTNGAVGQPGTAIMCELQ